MNHEWFYHCETCHFDICKSCSKLESNRKPGPHRKGGGKKKKKVQDYEPRKKVSNVEKRMSMKKINAALLSDADEEDEAPSLKNCCGCCVELKIRA